MSQNRTTSNGQNVDTVDQVSSVTLLGLAVVGGLLTVTIYWLIGG